MKTAVKNKSVESYIDSLPAGVQKTSRALHTVARKIMLEVRDIIYHKAIGYSLSDSPFDRICYVAPQPKGYVNFGFFFGGPLPDPAKLLIGNGKRLRHVKIFSEKEAKNPDLKKLIKEAWKKAEDDIFSWRQSLKRKQAINME